MVRLRHYHLRGICEESSAVPEFNAGLDPFDLSMSAVLHNSDIRTSISIIF